MKDFQLRKNFAVQQAVTASDRHCLSVSGCAGCFNFGKGGGGEDFSQLEDETERYCNH